MMELLYGLLGAAIGAGLFILGFEFGKRSIAAAPPPPATPAHVQTEEEERKLQEARERLREEQNAFHSLLNYNANMAYNIEPDRR